MLRLVSASIICSGLLIVPAVAQEPKPSLPLPQLTPCEAALHPQLPEKWRGTFLMAPFTKQQLVLGELVADASASAMRVRLHGLRSGSLDLFVLDKTTYVLTTEGSAIKRCQAIGDTGWRTLPTDWLGTSSRCAGAAPVGETPTQWWKTAIEPEPASYWVWYKTSDKSPFRLVFPFASNRLPPLSMYALSYQVRFEALKETELGQIAAACKSATSRSSANPEQKLRALIGAMSRSTDRAVGEIKRLMPQLDAACPAISFPKWPEKLALTGLMTPFDADENPYPAEVLYDWSVPGQRTRTFGGPEASIAAQDSLLLDPHGYTITHYRQQPPVCRPVLPGTIRPDWFSRAPCECMATIKGRTPLSPGGTTRIFACPLASPRVSWAWYTLSGSPTVFMVTSMPGDEGKRLFALLDYQQWLPGHSSSPAVFGKPPECESRNASDAPPPPSKRCSTCHLGPAPSP